MKYVTIIATLVAICNCKIVEISEKNLLINKANDAKAEDMDWYKNAVIYQVYPRSFFDTNGDGIGDIKGITQKLNHFKDLGVTGVWLSPIFQSPMADFGYDISDFRAIHPDYGTMEDFKKLLKEAKKEGLRIILDFVPNHASVEHQWFIDSVEKKEPYTDYFVWRKGTVKDGKKIPPNNWVSLFQGSQWTYNEKRDEWYLHQFLPEQPDLNFRNEAVDKEMKEVIKFWFDMGVDGFRIDAVPHLVEDKKFRDEGIHIWGEMKFGDGTRTQHQPETFELIYDWRKLCDEYTESRKVIFTEAYGQTQKIMKYYGDGDKDGAHFTFNFNFINLKKDSSARDFQAKIQDWLNYLPPGLVPNWVFGNHDQTRVATRLGVEKVDTNAMVELLLPGVAMIYQGDELGMTDGEVPKDQQVDPQGLRGGVSRDPERTPYHWNAEKNAGFSKGDTTWLPIAKNYKEVNFKVQSEAEESHYKNFKKLIGLHNLHVFQHGALDIRAMSDDVLAFTRVIEGDNIYVVVLNYGAKEETVDLTHFPFIDEDTKLTVEVKSVGSKLKEEGLEPTKLKLAAYESVVFKTDKVLKSSGVKIIAGVFMILIVSLLSVINL